MAKKRVTLADVARRAGLSSTAASLILNGRPATRLSEDAAARVRAAASELGYRPNVAARTLSMNQSKTIGFMSDSVATTRFAGPLILGALREARARDHVLLITETEDFPDAAAEAEMAATLVDRQVDGVLYSGVQSRHVTLPAPLRDVPVVLLNVTSDDPFPSVLPDEYAAGRAVAGELTRAGHGAGIVLVGARLAQRADPVMSTAVRRRLSGIADQLGDDGVELLAEVGREPWEPEFGHETVSALLRTRAPVTALLCLNDRLAIGAYWALAEHGSRVGTSVSVVSFDDDEAARFLRPALTTAALPHEHMGRRAVEILLGGPDPARETLIPMPLRRRDSVQPPAPGPVRSTRAPARRPRHRPAGGQSA